MSTLYYAQHQDFLPYVVISSQEYKFESLDRPKGVGT